MSRENVEVVRAIIEAWSAGDFARARAAMHPDIAWYDPPQQPGQLLRRGHAGVEESIRNWLGAWEDWRYEPGEMLDAGDQVLVIGRQSGRGKGSQVEVSADLFHLWTIRNGMAVEMRMFMERDEALSAAGLRD